jgi:hypothetical protein
LVLWPESFRGGCSFGTGLRPDSPNWVEWHYPAAVDLGKGKCRR